MPLHCSPSFCDGVSACVALPPCTPAGSSLESATHAAVLPVAELPKPRGKARVSMVHAQVTRMDLDALASPTAVTSSPRALHEFGLQVADSCTHSVPVAASASPVPFVPPPAGQVYYPSTVDKHTQAASPYLTHGSAGYDTQCAASAPNDRNVAKLTASSHRSLGFATFTGLPRFFFYHMR